MERNGGNVAWVGMVLCLAMAGGVQAQNQLTEAEKQQGYEQLFDGTAASFRANFVDYVKGDAANTGLSALWKFDAAQQAIVTTEQGPDIRSRRMFKDFELRMEYRNTGNQGIFYRMLVRGERPYHTGVEFAIDDNTSAAKDAPGAAYDLWGPKPNSYQLFSTGKWNSVRIRCVKDSVEHWVNGVKVVGFKLHSPAFWEAYNKSKWNAGNSMTLKVQGNRAAGYIDEGYIGLQGNHPGSWIIRNLRIVDLIAHPSSIGAIAMPAGKASMAFRRQEGALAVTRSAGGATGASFEAARIDGRVIGLAGNGPRIEAIPLPASIGTVQD